MSFLSRALDGRQSGDLLQRSTQAVFGPSESLAKVKQWSYASQTNSSGFQQIFDIYIFIPAAMQLPAVFMLICDGARYAVGSAPVSALGNHNWMAKPEYASSEHSKIRSAVGRYIGMTRPAPQTVNRKLARYIKLVNGCNEVFAFDEVCIQGRGPVLLQPPLPDGVVDWFKFDGGNDGEEIIYDSFYVIPAVVSTLTAVRPLKFRSLDTEDDSEEEQVRHGTPTEVMLGRTLSAFNEKLLDWQKILEAAGIPSSIDAEIGSPPPNGVKSLDFSDSEYS